jgi:hypothetical protein
VASLSGEDNSRLGAFEAGLRFGGAWVALVVGVHGSLRVIIDRLDSKQMIRPVVAAESRRLKKLVLQALIWID